MIKNPYNYLYYCYYKLFQPIKRKIDINHEVTANFMSMIVSTVIMIILVLTDTIKQIGSIMPLVIPVLLIFGIVYYFNKWYFLSSKRYRNIIKYFEGRVNIIVCKLLALGLILFSFVGFLLSIYF